MKHLIFIAVVFLPGACSTQTFYIVRHAEKADNSHDPELSQAGRDRAVRLEQYLANKKLDTVFTSNFKGTSLTGLTVAFPRSLPLIQLDQNPDNKLNKLIARLKNISINKGILVVGHTNTIPKIVFDLSGVQINPIGENAYGNLYTLTKNGKQVDLKHTTY